MYTSLDTRQTRDWRMQHACGSRVLSTWRSSCSQVAHCESWLEPAGLVCRSKTFECTHECVQRHCNKPSSCWNPYPSIIYHLSSYRCAGSP
jgi:hypothetical protein